ncbi:sigma-70 family RNA polymerase sigma factor [Telmatocola sphagniphila]|uniref:Sigma-70 family RNA polymerase sigma factor n=1 Tax=Telmatocola sphagniphila TaxID=1123043 RepID=A0A8E6EX60_9BACT|nr:sigma-70 family RNA polymerase sigma factor [Telmatocola sphagniphila]QVL31298.1 sigma-70 family RNA polymerase sigma factor [Telmatocola sphagniphila]
MPTSTNPERLLQDLRGGSSELLGPLLEQYRNYLKLLARWEIGHRLQGKLDASDLVQETFLDAHKYFPNFRGHSEGEFIQWIKKIMAGKLANHIRHYFGTQARDASRERAIELDLDQSSRLFDRGLMALQSSPSEKASQREQSVLLAEALEGLSPDYREVLILRHLEELTFPQISERMGRTLDSVQKLWIRALAQLRTRFDNSHE